MRRLARGIRYSITQLSALVPVLALMLSLSSCGRSTDDGSSAFKRGATHDKPTDAIDPNTRKIRVTDSFGLPLAGARVLIGTHRGPPSDQTLLVTNAAGEVDGPADWKTPLPITVEAPGHVRATYMKRSPGLHELRLRALTAAGTREIEGQTTDFGSLAQDGFIDVGVVFPAASRAAMINFQISSLLSPQSDTLQLPLGQSAKIPANLTLPRQRESYGVPVTIDKPQYRMSLPAVSTGGSQRLIALHGRLPVRKLVDGLRAGTPVLEMLDLLEFRGGGRRDISVSSGITRNQNIAVNQMRFENVVWAQAPIYDSRLVMLSLPLVDEDGALFPTDMKKIESGERKPLKYPKHLAAPDLILNILRARDLSSGATGRQIEEFSAALRTSAATPPSFIPLTRPPEVRGQTLVLDRPMALDSVSSLATYATYSQVETRQVGSLAFEIKIPIWDIYADGWEDVLDLPSPLDADALTGTKANVASNAKYRWEVSFLGDEIEEYQTPTRPPLGPALGPALLESVSHVSKNAVDLP